MNHIELTNWIFYIFLTIYIVTVLGTVIVVISENRNPLKSIAWIVVLLFFPIGGLIFYFFLGQDFRKQRMISRKSMKKINKHSHCHEPKPDISRLSASSAQEVLLLYHINYAKLHHGNAVEIFTEGGAMFQSLLENIEKAKHFVHLEFYIFSDDKLGHELKELLCRKVKEGVEVRLIYDDVGCWGVENRFFEQMQEQGVEVQSFLKVHFPAFANKLNYRNHRKIVIIDGEIGYIGGMNVADRYREGLDWGVWRDTHILIKGPGVNALQCAYSVDWYFMERKLLWDAKYFPKVEVAGDVSLQIATSGPIGEWKEIMLGIFKAIANAKKYVYIQTPYFLPTEALLQVLQCAALSNVDVRLMLPSRSDSKMVQMGGHSFVLAMLKAGVKVYFYLPGFLHSKMVVIDDELFTVGSANMDFRSFEHNFEANAFIYHARLTAEMKNTFLRDQKQSIRVNIREWRSRPLRQKAMESFARLFSPML